MAAAVENIFIPDSQWYPLNPYLNNNEQDNIVEKSQLKIVNFMMNYVIFFYDKVIGILPQSKLVK